MARLARGHPALPLLWVLSALSGAAGLIYQVAWVRLLSHHVGGTHLAVSAVLAVFMTGLALGGSYFGRRADRMPSPMRAYVLLELGIGMLGWASPTAVVACDPIYVAVVRGLHPAWHLWVNLALAAVVVGPASFLMGGTLPLLGRLLVRTSGRLARDLGCLYALNTLGAMVGAFLAGFVLVEALGVGGTIRAAASLNLAVAAAAWAMVPRDAAGPERGWEPVPVPVRSRGEPLRPGLASVVLAGSGFAMLGLEVYWTRALQPFLGNSTYAFASMLTTILAGLALGAYCGGHLADRSSSPLRLLGRLQRLGALAALFSAFVIWEVFPRLGGTALLSHQAADWREYVLRRFVLAGAIMLVPAFLSGASFPVGARVAVPDASGIAAGVGRLFAANTLGAVLGAVFGGYVLMPLVGTKAAILATGVWSGVLGVVASCGGPSRRDRILSGGGLLAIVCLALSMRHTGSAVPAVSQQPGDEVLYSRDDREAETRVYRKPDGDLHMSVNGQFIGGTGRDILRKELILAHLPMAMVPRAEEVLTVGLGSGITLGAFAAYPEVRRLTCVEIVPGVVEAARLFAGPNGGALDDRRVTVHVDDGAQFLRLSRERWDVICSDSKLNPAYAGNAPLLSADYYELCRDHLTDDGVMVQWVPLHVPPEELRLILRSFAASFPHVAVFWHAPANVLMAGARTSVSFHAERLAGFQDLERVRVDRRRLQVENPYALANLWLAADERLRERLGLGESTTWDRPVLEFRIVRGLLATPSWHAEDRNLAWFLELFDPSPAPVRGPADAGTSARFRRSSWFLLRGYEAGVGARDLRRGMTLFAEAARENPADHRPAILLRGAPGAALP